MDEQLETAVFGGGCFWCTEAVFSRLKGVESVESGYAGGQTVNPTYEQVSAGDTGHAEAIRIEFNPSTIKFTDLLNVFFATHDATTLNRQGNDVGTQYRSAIFYTSEAQRDQARGFIEQLDIDEPCLVSTSDGESRRAVVTEVTALNKFWPAESYHQRYYELNSSKPYCSVIISPKIAKLREKFLPLLKPQ